MGVHEFDVGILTTEEMSTMSKLKRSEQDLPLRSSLPVFGEDTITTANTYFNLDSQRLPAEGHNDPWKIAHATARRLFDKINFPAGETRGNLRGIYEHFLDFHYYDDTPSINACVVGISYGLQVFEIGLGSDFYKKLNRVPLFDASRAVFSSLSDLNPNGYPERLDKKGNFFSEDKFHTELPINQPHLRIGVDMLTARVGGCTPCIEQGFASIYNTVEKLWEIANPVVKKSQAIQLGLPVFQDILYLTNGTDGPGEQLGLPQMDNL
jgi:hypothetical protein